MILCRSSVTLLAYLCLPNVVYEIIHLSKYSLRITFELSDYRILTHSLLTLSTLYLQHGGVVVLSSVTSLLHLSIIEFVGLISWL